MFQILKRTFVNLVFLSVLIIPSVIFAGKFNTDSALTVYPENEILNFQTVKNQKQTLSFSIQNSSNQDKRLEIIEFPTNGFEYRGGSINNISANTSNYLSIQFQQSQAGEYSSQLRLRHPDTGETKTIRFFANVKEENINSGIALSHSEINFGSKPVGSDSQFTLSITNNTPQAINISVSTPGAPFAITKSPTQIQNYETENIIISFNPKKANIYQENLIINTSDRNKQTITLKLKGQTDEINNSSINQPTQDGNLQFSTQSLVFSDIKRGESQSQKVKVSNPNNFPVTININPQPSKPFKVEILGGISNKTTIPAKSDAVLNVTYQPTQNNTYSDSFSLQTNLKNNPKYDFQVKGSHLTLANNNSRPFPVANKNNPTLFNVTRNTINPDLNELVYFNFTLGDEFNNSNNRAYLSIKNPNTKQTIKTQSLGNLAKGAHNNKLVWDGSNFQQETMLAGTYLYEVTLVSPDNRQKFFAGQIKVERQKTHTPNPIQTTNNNQTFTQTKNFQCLQFTDVNKNSSLCSALYFAQEQNLLNESETRFNPNQKVNREQAIKIISDLLDIESQASKNTLGATDPVQFTDVKPDSNLFDYINNIQKLDPDNMVLQGYKKTENNIEKIFFNPNQNISRAEMYKLLFEIASIQDTNKTNFLLDYYLTEQPFKDTRIDSQYDWFTPYAGIAQKEFNGTNFARKYFNHFILSDGKQNFSPYKQITKEELFEFIYETKKLKVIQYK